MKKSLLLAGVALLASVSVSAQSCRLKSVTSSDDLIHLTYSYDDNGRFSRVHRDALDDITYYDTLYYNAKDQIDSDLTYQYFNDDDAYRLVSKCCYGYDDNGNVVWRDNYNLLGGTELQQSAHIVYTYDDANHMIKQAQYWAFDLNNPFTVIEYTYNEGGQLTVASERYADFATPTLLKEGCRVEYDYDQKGQMVRSYNYSIENGEASLTTSNEYDYDELGNVVEHRVVLGSSVTAKNVYRYDVSVPASEVLYPVSHEYNIGLTFGLNSKLVEEDVYADDNNDDVVQAVYVYTNTYSYETCGTSGIQQVTTPAVWVDANAKVLRLVNGGSCDVRVYGQGGTLVLSLRAKGSADLSTLPAGIYFAKVKDASGVAYYQKFLIR